MSATSRLVPLVRGSLKVAAAGIDVLHRPPRGVTILIYHRVGAGSGSEMDLGADVFEAQLDWLTEHRDVVDLDAALDMITGCAQHRPSGREVVLTFDDGTGDWVDNVLPALERHRTPATFYVATSYIAGGTRGDDTAATGPARDPSAPPMLSWSALGELASSELTTIGSHTHGHMLLDRLETDRIADELDRSIELLAEHTGAAPRHFAYPKAVSGSAEARAAVKHRFRSAVIAGTRPNPPGTDPHSLHRSPVQASDAEQWFRRKALGGMRAEDDLRRLANRVRYRKLDS